MPLQATSGAASQDAFGGNGVAVVPTYIEDVFSTYLYTGNNSTQTITNGIDLSGKGGLVWAKKRNTTPLTNHLLFDTLRGVDKILKTSSTDAEVSASSLSAFNSNGFTVENTVGLNQTGELISSWTFREQAKFFDVVTYTGNAVQGRQIAHSLGSTAGCIIVKCTSTTSNWTVYHRSLTTNYILQLNSSTSAINVGSPNAYVSAPTDTTFTVGNDSDVNASGATYVAYLFAHDAGGFGLTGTDNVISCGSYAGNGSELNGTIVNLGYEPQFLLIKAANTTADWFLIDNIRGWGPPNLGTSSIIKPNLTSAETSINNSVEISSTGFKLHSTSDDYNGSTRTYIYIAIRRPMKVPTTGTSVFAPITYTGTNVDNRLVNTGIVTDMTMARIRTASSTGSFYTADRLRGNASLGTAITDAENTDADSFMTPTVGYGNSFSAMNGFGVGNDVTRQLNQSSTSQLAYAFRRAPGFFDQVCYTGTGFSAATNGLAAKNHNLGVEPEMIIVKARSSASFNWMVYQKYVANPDPTAAYGTRSVDKRIFLNLDSAASTDEELWGDETYPPTDLIFRVRSNNSAVNSSGTTYVAYLFASCPGVSKVGSYTGTGTTQVINCGFTAGSRFVLIKRTDSTGDWYVWDSARGIIAGNDPYLLLNSTAAEVTSTDYIDTYSAGFEISSTAPAAINASGGTYIFLAIA